MEEKKENEALTHYAYGGDVVTEEDTKVDELIAASLDIEQDPFSELQIHAQEPSQRMGDAMGVDPVKKDGQDIGENVRIQTESRDEVEADKTSELLGKDLESLENVEKLHQDVEYQTGYVSEKEPGSQEELHVDISMFAGGDVRNPSDAMVTENSGDAAAVTTVGDENAGDGRSGTNGTLVEIPNQIDSGVTDEKDKDTNEEVRNDLNDREVNGKGGVSDFLGPGKLMGPFLDSEDDGTEEEQAAFLKDLETFYRHQHGVEFKTPKFYKEDLNLLKLWRAVIPLGGYEQVTSCKLWRQVGESFNPPKTCTTISYAFRIFYEKALFEYEKHLTRSGALRLPGAQVSEYVAPQHQVSASGRARRDSATRAMQGWHAHRLGNGEAVHTVNKEKNATSTPISTKEKQLDTDGMAKRKLSSPVEQALRVVRSKTNTPQFETLIVDAGMPASWVKINVLRTRESFEIYCLVPGLLREEVKVQSDPAGRVVITGEPEQLDNPWGVTPFKKVVTLPSRIDPHQTSAVITLHGQLYIRVPFEQPNV